MQKRLCTAWRLRSLVEMPSMRISPCWISWKRMSRLTRVVLPAPVGPTMAIFCPGWATAEKSWMTVVSVSS